MLRGSFNISNDSHNREEGSRGGVFKSYKVMPQARDNVLFVFFKYALSHRLTYF